VVTVSFQDKSLAAESIPYTSSYKHRRFSDPVEKSLEAADPLHVHMRHVRQSERHVQDVIYETLAALKGLRLSTNEASQALVKKTICLIGSGNFTVKPQMFLTFKHFLMLETFPLLTSSWKARVCFSTRISSWSSH